MSNSESVAITEQPQRFLIAASGTGGHLFPALAVAEVLEAEQFQLEWLGVSNRLETQLVPKNIPYGRSLLKDSKLG